MENNETFPRAQVEIHENIIEFLTNHFVKHNNSLRLKVLDAAAGNGFMSNWLNVHGFDVTPMDIDTSQWKVDGLYCKQQDFNRLLELENESFDLVISIETIEHLENPFQFLRELTRVLKKNGTLIVSTPNVHSSQSRLKYLFLGLPSLFEYIADDKLGHHITPVNIGMFLDVFSKSNIKLVEIISTGPKVVLLKKLIWKALNIVTIIWNYIFESQIRRGPDYYLFQLNRGQYYRLLENVSLIVIGKKLPTQTYN